MSRGLFAVCALGLALLCMPGAAQEPSPGPGTLLEKGPGLRVGGERLLRYTLVQRFYAAKEGATAWGGTNRIRAYELLAELQSAPEDGLQSGYHAAKLAEMLEREPDPASEAALDLLLTDAYLAYAGDLARGRIDPRRLGLSWQLRRDEPDLVQLLQDALAAGTLKTSLRTLLPGDPQYMKLRQTLADYRKIADTGAALKTVRKGDSGAAVVSLQQRLFLLGDLVESGSVVSDVFDDSLEQAVQRFQRRHGLNDDGIVGPATLEELRVPVSERIRQIVASMERLRWMPGQMPDRYVLINVPAFQLQAWEQGRPVLNMRTVVGKKGWCTPPFLDSEIRSVELNPDWNVPTQIVSRELLHTIRKDPGYLKRNNFVVLQDSSGKREAIDPDAVDWNADEITPQSYRFRQRPGSRNPLGKIKFQFPNNYGCYLHDTSTHELFERSFRAFSHGCVRVEMPLELAGFVFQGSPVWTQASIATAIEEGSRSRIPTPQPVPIYFVYFTAWVDQEGVQFRRDIYGQDRLLLRSAGL